MATVEIIPIPLGHKIISTIVAGESIDKNDFLVLLVWSENVTGLTLASISALNDAIIISLEGKNSVYVVRVRPLDTPTTTTIIVEENAVNEGNSYTASLAIFLETSFPSAIGSESSTLFRESIESTDINGIAVTPTRQIVNNGTSLFFYDGNRLQRDEQLDGIGSGPIDYINGDFIIDDKRRSLLTGEILQDFPLSSARAIVHTRLGFLQTSASASSPIKVLPYGATETSEIVDLNADPNFIASSLLAHQNDYLYVVRKDSSGAHFYLYHITDDDKVELVCPLNIRQRSESSSALMDITIYEDTLYTVEDRGSIGSTYTLDIRPYRLLSMNTKTRIDVQFVDEGGTLNLTPFAPDAERIVFAVGSDKLTYLSINANNEIAVASNAVTETAPVLVKLTAINRIDSIDFEFYLVILQAAAPVWRKVSELTMRADSRYDLFQIVPDADSIEYRSGRDRLADSSVSNGAFRVGTVGGTAEFTARKGGRSSHIEINIDVVQARDRSSFSDIFRHRVEIAGIDVTADVSVFPTVSATLDAVILNNYQPNEVVLTLKSNNTNNYKYNEGVANNFWQSNNLKPAGFKEHIKVCVESLVDGRYVSQLLFSGTIHKSNEMISDAGVQLTCVDESKSMQETLVEDFGTLEKWDTLRRQSDESNLEGVYVPEGSLLPMQISGSKAFNDQIQMILRRLALPSEGPAIPNTGHLTPSQFLTSGGYLETNPLLMFKTQHRSEDVRFLINQLALNKIVYNAEIDLPAVELDDPFILNRGSVALSVEKTRITRLPVDWVYDSTNDRLLILLSNPEAHVADLLVQYNLSADTYRILHTFDTDISVHRLARRTSTDYYILSAKAISQDRSAPTLPHPMDSTGYAYDSVAEESEINILRYNASTDTVTEHVDKDNSRPPQLGIHYHVGFENKLYIDEFEGIRPDYRGPFKWHSNNLYYRYATPSEFGVARVDTSGTTTEMIDQTETLNYNNHLNFAFDITSGGDIYFVYVTGDENTSTLVIKRRTSGGTESTILTDTRELAGFLDIHREFGAYLGAHECLFHNDDLYILAPIQSADFGENPTNTQADPDFIIEIADTGMTGERSVTTSTNLNPTSTRLAPGDVIPIRIDFNSSVSGATQSDLTVYGGIISSFSISSDMIDVRIRPNDTTQHRNIVIDLAENAVTQRNEKTRIIVDFGTRRSREKSAGAVLYRVNVNAGTPTLQVVEKYDFVQLGACNLVVHDNAVHFVEHPPAGARFKPINPDLDGYYTDDERKQTMGYNLVPESLGALKRINFAGEVEHLGNLWHEMRPSNIAATRCLSIDGDLHVTMAYGNLDEILQANSLASKPDNVQHLVYGKKLHYVLPTLDTNNNRYALLADIAKKVNATLSFENGLIVIRDRNPYRAKTDGNTGTGTADLDFEGQNKAFPSDGYLRIGKEILKFTGISSGKFTGIKRGILATEVTNHPDNTPILYLDEVLESDRISGRPTFSTDTARIYNIIRNADNTAEEPDPTSIAKYGELPYTLDLGLTKHELAWQAYILKNYLEHLKEPQQRINLTLKPTNYLEIGQIIGVKYGMLVYAVQILSITKNKQSTQIRCRTVGV